MNIVILADSRALPRSSERTPYAETYPYLLDRAVRARYGSRAPVIIERGMRYRTVHEVVGDWHEEVILKDADVVIVQVGGNDCVTRLLLPRERAAIEKFPIRRVSRWLTRLELKYRKSLMRWLPKRVCVPLDQFEQGVNEIVRRAQNGNIKAVLLVPILGASRHILNACPGTEENRLRYNQVLVKASRAERVHFIDLIGAVEREKPREITIDGMHYSAEVQRILARLLDEWLASSELIV